jgi:ABC-type polysaccharide/polyol phosphate export permease
VIRQLRALWERRALIWYLVRSDLKVTYKNKALGYLWTLLDPLMMMLVYVVLVQVIFKQGGAQFPVLLFSALLAWRWFTHSVQQATSSISSKEKLIQTVAFPRIILPTQDVVAGLVNYVLSLGALVPMMVIFHVNWSFNILWLPAIVGVQFVLTLGVAVLCAVIGVYFRDIENILAFGLRMVWYMSPALWALADRVPERLQTTYLILNPFASLFEAYKSVLVRGEPPLAFIGVAFGLGVGLLITGLLVFDRFEARLAKDV